jgi:hypothetical protein
MTNVYQDKVKKQVFFNLEMDFGSRIEVQFALPATKPGGIVSCLGANQ